MSFIISSCLGVFCWQSQHCPLSYHPVLVSSVVYKVSTVLYHIILPWYLLLLTKSALSFIISSCLGVFCCWQSQHCPLSYHHALVSSQCCWQSQHCPLSYHLVLVSSVVYKVSIVLYNIILPWCLLLTKSALSFIISSCLGVFCCVASKHCPLSYHPALVSSQCCWQSQHCPLSYHLVLVSSVVYKVSTVLYNIILPWCLLLTKSALSFIISSCLGVFCCVASQHCPLSYHHALVSSQCCWQSQHCPLSYHLVLVSSVVYKVSTVLYNIILPWCLLLFTKSALSFIISSCLGVFCCLQSQHCPLSYHLALVSSVVDKVSTVLYHIIMPWCLLLLTKSALSFIISSCLGVFSVLLTKSALSFIISSCLGVVCCVHSQHCPL